MTERMHCRVCGWEGTTQTVMAREQMYGSLDEFDYFECPKCHCLQILKVPDNLGDYYRNESYYSFEKPDMFYDPALEAKEQPRILDVGCGAGAFCCDLVRRGFRRVEGCDPFLENEFHYDNGVVLHNCSVHEMPGEEIFDQIFLNDSFEHVTDPNEVMDSLYRLLKPNGFLVLRLPVYPNIAYDMFGTDWFQMDAPRHIVLYSRSGLKDLALRHGLVVTEEEDDSGDAQILRSFLYTKGIPFFEQTMEKAGQYFSETDLEQINKTIEIAKKNKYGDHATFMLGKLPKNVLILEGEDPCMGVLNHFRRAFGEALHKAGESVLYSGDADALQEIHAKNYKAVIGFQADGLGQELLRESGCRRFNFLLDNPVFILPSISQCDREQYLLCQDEGYADFARRYLGFTHAVAFPPAGDRAENMGPGQGERAYDLVFLGSFFCPKSEELTAEQSRFYEYLLIHSDMPFHKAWIQYQEEQGAHPSEEDVIRGLQQMRDTCLAAAHTLRMRIVEAILDRGLSIHVFGDTWKNYPDPGKRGRLILHPQVDGAQTRDIYHQAKISLNVMTWHKAGMTERIAESMLAGAVCVSESTSYLKEHFTENEICLFDPKHPEEAADLVQQLLKDEPLRNRMALNAFEKASREHTWDKRAEALCAMMGREE